jgi:hypothetical protein
MLAKALMDMKYEDRTKVEERIHGIGSETEVVETPELIRDAIQNFEIVLQQKYTSNPDHPDLKGYHMARQNQWAYATCPSNENLRIRFIRTVRYDIEKAVDRFCYHLTYRLFLFGPDSLQRPLEVDDLRYDAKTGRREPTTRAYKYFKTGSIQVLPGRDRAGRRVVFHHLDPKGQSFEDEVSAFLIFFPGQ